MLVPGGAPSADLTTPRSTLALLTPIDDVPGPRSSPLPTPPILCHLSPEFPRRRGMVCFPASSIRIRPYDLPRPLEEGGRDDEPFLRPGLRTPRAFPLAERSGAVPIRGSLADPHALERACWRSAEGCGRAQHRSLTPRVTPELHSVGRFCGRCRAHPHVTARTWSSYTAPRLCVELRPSALPPSSSR